MSDPATPRSLDLPHFHLLEMIVSSLGVIPAERMSADTGVVGGTIWERNGLAIIGLSVPSEGGFFK